MSRINCQVWILLNYGSAYSAIALASGSLALRTIVFWNNHKIVIGLVISLWVLNISFLIYGATQGRSIWDMTSNECIELDTTRDLKNILVTFSTDLALLAIMLSGIWCSRKASGLWKLVYHQGILWVAGATFGELPCIILTLLDFNDPLNVLFEPFFCPSPNPVSRIGGQDRYTNLRTTRALCATKMYRELCECATPVRSTQYSGIDISPMKFISYRPSAVIDVSITDISEEFVTQPSNNKKPEPPFNYPREHV